MKFFYYYLRDHQHNHPLVTVCLGVNYGHIARGVAVCSDSEPFGFDRKEGRDRARARVREALGTKQSGYPCSRRECFNVLERLPACTVTQHILDRKMVYRPILTEFELKILDNG